MATSPLTAAFFSSTTVPVYALTAVFPEPPICFGAQPGASYTFSPTAYPPPILPGGYYPSPFAATYPYPTPASPAEAPGFSPVQECDSSTAAIHSSVAPPCVPQSHTSSTPRDDNSTTILTTASKTYPAITPQLELHGPDEGELPRRWANSVLERPALAPLLELTNSGKPIPMETELVLTTPKAHHAHIHSSEAACIPITSEVCSYLASDAAVLTAADERVQAKDAIRHRQQSELLNIQVRLNQRQAHDRTSFDTIQATTALLFSGTGTSTSSSVSSPSDALQMFDGKPTPQSVYENCWSGHHNPIQSPCQSTLSEQTLGPVFDTYDDDMDGCSTELFDVFVGTPEQQKFGTELIAVDVEVLDGCSNEPVHVFTDTPELQTYEEANHGSGQAPKNFIKPIFGSERSTVGVFSLATRQTPDTELCGKHVKPQVNNQQWNMQMTEARRNEWDPGIRQIIVDVPMVVNWSSSTGLTHAEIFSPHIYAATYIPNILVSLPLYMLWDPGDTNLRTLFTTPSDASITAFTPLFGFTPLSESKTMVKSAWSILSSTSSAAAIFSPSSSSLPFGGSFAVPEPVFTFYDDKPDGCSNEFVHVFTSTPEQLLKCVGKGPETEQTIAYLNYLTDVQQKHGVEKAAVHVQQLRDHQSKVLIIHEKRKEWDPGASLPLMSSKAQHSSYALQPAIDATILAGSSATRFSGCKCLTFWVQNNSYALWKSEIGMPTYMSRDPGVLNIIDMMPDKYTVPNNAQFMQQTAELSFLSLTACIQYMTSNGNNSVLQDTSFFLQKAAHFSQGILSLMDVMMDKTAVPNQVHSGQTTCEQLTFIGQPVDLMKFWTWLLLQSSSWYSNPNAFLQVLYCYLQIVMDCLYLKPVKQLVCYTSMFRSNARCTSIAVTIRMRLVLCSGEIAQEGRDVAVVYRAFKLQLQMRKTSQIWDPGIEFILYELWWLSQRTGYVLKLVTHSYTYVTEPAPSQNQVTSTYVWNTGSMLLQYKTTWLHMPLLNDLQCLLPMSNTSCSEDKFIIQKRVHAHYKAKKLPLLTLKYLQIWEMDIIFITFLPP